MNPDTFIDGCHCGAELEFPARDGLVCQDESVWCHECGCAAHINIEESAEDDGVGSAYASTNELVVINVAQPRCNGLCVEGAAPEFLRENPLCRLDCPRVNQTCRESAAARIVGGETP
jgi:hypothetical protein